MGAQLESFLPCGLVVVELVVVVACVVVAAGGAAAFLLEPQPAASTVADTSSNAVEIFLTSFLSSGFSPCSFAWNAVAAQPIRSAVRFAP
jgi:hypothetical protein